MKILLRELLWGYERIEYNAHPIVHYTAFLPILSVKDR